MIGGSNSILLYCTRDLCSDILGKVLIYWNEFWKSRIRRNCRPCLFWRRWRKDEITAFCVNGSHGEDGRDLFPSFPTNSTGKNMWKCQGLNCMVSEELSSFYYSFLGCIWVEWNLCLVILNIWPTLNKLTIVIAANYGSKQSRNNLLKHEAELC